MRYSGVYRGVVVDDGDPQMMNRYRVHVYGVHHQSVRTSRPDGTPTELQPGTTESIENFPVGPDTRELSDLRDGGDTPTDAAVDFFSGLPWAEVVGYGAKGSGLIPVFNVGDLVWIVFEHGDQRFPMIMGGWTSNQFGAPDIAPENAIDATEADLQSTTISSYATVRFRAQLFGRRGQVFETSDVPEESWAKIQAGSAVTFYRASDDSIRTFTPGTMMLRSRSLDWQGVGAFLSADYEIILSTGIPVDYDSPDYPTFNPENAALIGIYSAWEADLYAKDQITIGQYVERQEASGSDTSSTNRNKRDTANQTRLVWAAPKMLYLGYCCPKPAKEHLSYPYPDIAQMEDQIDGAFHPKQTKEDSAHYGAYLNDPSDTFDLDALYKTDNVRVEAFHSVVLRACSPQRVESGGENDGGLVGLYSTHNIEITAGHRVWIGQHYHANELADDPTTATGFAKADTGPYRLDQYGGTGSFGAGGQADHYGNPADRLGRWYQSAVVLVNGQRTVIGGCNHPDCVLPGDLFELSYPIAEGLTGGLTDESDYNSGWFPTQWAEMWAEDHIIIRNCPSTEVIPGCRCAKPDETPDTGDYTGRYIRIESAERLFLIANEEIYFYPGSFRIKGVGLGSDNGCWRTGIEFGEGFTITLPEDPAAAGPQSCYAVVNLNDVGCVAEVFEVDDLVTNVRWASPTLYQQKKKVTVDPCTGIVTTDLHAETVVLTAVECPPNNGGLPSNGFVKNGFAQGNSGFASNQYRGRINTMYGG